MKVDPCDYSMQSGSALEIANSVWISIVEEFVYQINFEDNGAGGKVNLRVKHSTRDLVDSLVPEESTVLAILATVNSIYLEANRHVNCGIFIIFDARQDRVHPALRTNFQKL
jgi:hypothetical protein